MAAVSPETWGLKVKSRGRRGETSGRPERCHTVGPCPGQIRIRAARAVSHSRATPGQVRGQQGALPEAPLGAEAAHEPGQAEAGAEPLNGAETGCPVIVCFHLLTAPPSPGAHPNVTRFFS